MNQTITTDVNKCAACGNDHAALTFLLLRTPYVDKKGVTWTYFSSCPETNKTIFLRQDNVTIDEATP